MLLCELAHTRPYLRDCIRGRNRRIDRMDAHRAVEVCPCGAEPLPMPLKFFLRIIGRTDKETASFQRKNIDGGGRGYNGGRGRHGMD